MIIILSRRQKKVCKVTFFVKQKKKLRMQTYFQCGRWQWNEIMERTLRKRGFKATWRKLFYVFNNKCKSHIFWGAFRSIPIFWYFSCIKIVISFSKMLVSARHTHSILKYIYVNISSALISKNETRGKYGRIIVGNAYLFIFCVFVANFQLDFFFCISYTVFIFHFISISRFIHLRLYLSYPLKIKIGMKI